MVKSHNMSHPLILNTPIVLSQICVLYINSLLDHGFWGLFNIRILLNPINYSSITMNHPFNPRNSIIWVCLKIGYIPNEIAIKNRDNDQQNHWVKRATRHFQTKPYIKIPVNPIKSHWPIAGGSDLGGLLLGQPAERKFQGFRAWAKGLWTERWSHGLTESPRLIDFMVYNTCKYNT